MEVIREWVGGERYARDYEYCDVTFKAQADRVLALFATPAASSDERDGAWEGRFWLIVHEPGNVPERKGSWPRADLPKVMREFIAARPDAYLTVLTVGADGTPDVQHGPEALQMADGRSMSVGSKHNARTKAAHSAALAASRPTDAGAGTSAENAQVATINAVFAENINEQASRLGVHPVETESPGWWQQRVRKAAVLAALATPKPPVDETLEQQWLRIAEGVRDQQAEPTEAMWQAAWKASEDYFCSDKVTQEGFRRGLSAMLAAIRNLTGDGAGA